MIARLIHHQHRRFDADAHLHDRLPPVRVTRSCTRVETSAPPKGRATRMALHRHKPLSPWAIDVFRELTPERRFQDRSRQR